LDEDGHTVCNVKKARMELVKDDLQSFKEKESGVTRLCQMMQDALAKLQEETAKVQSILLQVQSSRTRLLDSIQGSRDVFEEAKKTYAEAVEQVSKPSDNLGEVVDVLQKKAAVFKFSVDYGACVLEGSTTLEDEAARVLLSRFCLSGKPLLPRQLSGE
jgi:chromosome segregation ATPase